MLRLVGAVPLLYAAAVLAQTSGYGSVGGKVTDSAGIPIRSGRIEILDPAMAVVGAAVTDSTGRYLISRIPALRHALRIQSGSFPMQYWAPGGNTSSLTPNGWFDVPVDDTLIINVRLVLNPTPGDSIAKPPPDTGKPYQPPIVGGPGESMVRVRLVDTTGAVIRGFTSGMLFRLQDFFGLYITDTTGALIFSGVPSGTFVLQILSSTTQGYPSQFYHPTRNTTGGSHTFSVGARDTIDIEFEMIRDPVLDGWLAALVHDSVSMPLKGATLDVFLPDDLTSPIDSAVSDTMGRALVMHIPSVHCFVRIRAPGFPEQWHGWTQNTTSPYETVYTGSAGYILVRPQMQLATMASVIKVLLQDSAGATISDTAQVFAYEPESKGTLKVPAVRVSQGTYEIRGLRSGVYQVFAEAGNYPAQFYDPVRSTREPRYLLTLGEQDTVSITFSLVADPVFIGRIAGYVMDSLWMPLISSVKVELYATEDTTTAVMSQTTDAQGKFYFDSLPQPSYYIRLVPPEPYPIQWFAFGKNTLTPFESIYSGRGSELGIRLIPHPSSLSNTVVVMVVDSTGRPVPTVTGVVLESDRGDVTVSATQSSTDASRFIASPVPPGQYACRVYGTEYPAQYHNPMGNTVDKSFYIGVASLDTIYVQVRLTREVLDSTPTIRPFAGVISGTVVDKVTAKPLAGIRVSAIPATELVEGKMNYSSPYEGRTDQTGVYVVSGITPGSYAVVAWPDTGSYMPQFYSEADVPSAARILRVDTVKITGIGFALRSGAILSGTVKTVDGQPANFADVQLSSTITYQTYWTTTDAQGRYVFRGLVAGTYRLDIGYSQRYRIAPNQQPQTVSILTGASATAQTLIVERGGTIVGTFSFPASLPSDSGKLWGKDGFSIAFFPAVDSLQKPWPEWITPAWTWKSPGEFETGYCPVGTWRLIFMPGPVYAPTNTAPFVKSAGWTLASQATSLALSPAVPVKSADTTQGVSVTFREGYSVFGTFTTERGEYTSTDSAGRNYPYGIEAMTRDGNRLITVSTRYFCPDGRIEFPGLIDGQEYFFHIWAQGYPSQYWSPAGNTIGPATPYKFSTATFVPLGIRAVANPEGSGPTDSTGPTQDPVRLWPVYDNSNRPWIECDVDKALGFDSLYLFSKDRKGTTERVFAVAVTPDSGRYRWLETRDVRSAYHYIAVAKKADATMRSRPTGDARDGRIVAKDSLWIDLYAGRYGIDLIWGGGAGYAPGDTDSVYVYRRPAATVAWSLLEKRPANWDHWITDSRFDRRLDSGRTFDYQVRLLRSGSFLRWSPIIGFPLDAAFYAVLSSSRILRVGAGNPYMTIQAAVDAAGDFDRIVVTSGTYKERVSTQGKILALEADWRDGTPPVIDPSMGVAITVAPTAPKGTNRGLRINGFRFRNASAGIRTQSSIEVSQCLFTSTSNAVVADIDSAGTVSALRTDPFLSTELGVFIHQCTFVGGGSGDAVCVLTARGPAESVTASGTFNGPSPFQLLPISSLTSIATIGQSILANYTSPVIPITTAGNNSRAYLEKCNLWKTSTTPASNRIQTGEIYRHDPLFVDTVHYFLSATSPLRSLGYNGSTIGYDGKRLEQKGEQGPGPITNLRRSIAGLKAVSLTWTPSPAQDKVVRYIVYRVPADSTLFSVADSQWQYSGPEPTPLATVTGTSFVDTTVVLGSSYVYAVCGLDSAGRQGNVRMPYPPALSEYAIGITFRQFAKVRTASLAGGRWHMVGPWGVDSICLAPSPSRQMYTWDPARTSDKLLARYAPATCLRAGRGYWVWTDSGVSIPVDSTSFAALFRDAPASARVRLAPGWNQIASPYPFPVAPKWPAGFDVFQWNAAGRFYDTARVIYPWQAVWVYSSADTTVIMEGRAFTGATAAAKEAAGPIWELQVSLLGEKGSDPANFVGIVNRESGLFRTGREPPEAFGSPQLFFLPPAQRPGEDRDPSLRLSRHYVVSGPIPSRKVEWTVGLAPWTEAASVRISGMEAVPDKVGLFWVTRDSVTDLRSTPEITVSGHSETRYAYLVATADRAEISLYANRFELRGNHPNPFRRRTVIRFVIPYAWNADGSKRPGDDRDVRLSLYDLHGRCVRVLASGRTPVGVHSVSWDGSFGTGHFAPTGFYLARLQCEGMTKTVRMVKVK